MAQGYIPSFLCLVVFVANFIPHLACPVFVLGDSTADVGTNSFIPGSQARADFPYYGIDFPHGRSTGRFSNGFNSADYLAKHLGLRRSPPPYLFLVNQTSGHHKFLEIGVNLASGGSGLLDSTGSDKVVVSLSTQISQFASLRDNLTRLIGQTETESKLSKALFFISVGSNDIFEYFNKTSTTPVDEFIDNLMLSYTNHIEALYKLGARKFGIISVAPIGCCPAQRLVQKNLTGTDGCFEAMNNVSLAFYSALDALMYDMSSQLPEIKYSLGNAYKMTIDVINDPGSQKFVNVDTACCGTGSLNAQGRCNAKASLCPDRRSFLFWDMFHPTQRASCLAAEALYYGPTTYVSPINFFQLANDN